jgi:hypothetical protein
VRITYKYIITFVTGIQTSVVKCHLLFQIFVPVSSVVFYVFMDDISGSGSNRSSSKSSNSSSLTQNFSAEFHVKSTWTP